MRKTLTFLTVFLFIIVGAAFIIGMVGSTSHADSAVRIKLSDEDSGIILLNEDKNGLTVRMDIGVMEFIPVSTPEGSFILPRVEGFTRSFKVGEPTIPVAAKLISIPFDCQLQTNVLDYTTQEIDLASYGLTYPLMPVQPPLSKSQDPASVKFEYNRSVYTSNSKYALALADAEVLGTMRADHLGRIAIAPVEYYSSENKLTVYTSVTVRIKFKNPNWGKTDAMKSRYSSAVYNSEVLNPESRAVEDDLVKYPIKYAIVSDRMFESQLQPFIQWKTKKGFDVVVGYTDTIGATATSIKNWLESLYNAGTTEDPAPSFVLFVGDAQQIPTWDGSAGQHITDLPYCEFTDDNFPEIYYGRFSAQTTALLQPQIDKTMEYEQYTMPDPSYLGEVTLVSGVDNFYAETHGNGQINYGTTNYFNVAHGIAPNVWLYPDSDASSARTEVIATISAGVGFYNYTAHCSHTGPADPAFTPTDISTLTNAHKYLLGIGNCCLSNTFGTDYSTPCFGEAWLQAEDKGGIGWIGATNNSLWDEDYWWGVGSGPVVAAGPTYEETGIGAYDGVFHDHGEPVTRHYTTNAAIIFAGNMAVTEAGSSRTTYYWEMYHLMGDPSVMTYMGVPSTNSVTHPTSITTTDASVNVQANPGSYVGISRDGVLHGAGYIGDTGSATIAITPIDTEGDADIVVTCQNRIPYISTISVSGSTTPPTAGFVGTPTSGAAPLTVNFTDQSTGAASWSWNFGDTGTSTERNPTHIYNTAGTYTVTLVVTNSYGSDTEIKTGYITVTTTPPVADFTFSANLLTVTFTDQSYDPDGTVAGWNWNFGDGNTSTQQNPVHTFAANGTYSVTLTVTDNEGATGNVTKQVTVNDGSEPELYVDDISMRITAFGRNYIAYADITIKDTDGNVVPNATISATWSGIVSGSSTRVTGTDGTATFTSPKTKTSGTFTITVTNVTHATLDYNAVLNNETSDSITY